MHHSSRTTEPSPGFWKTQGPAVAAGYSCASRKRGAMPRGPGPWGDARGRWDRLLWGRAGRVVGWGQIREGDRGDANCLPLGQQCPCSERVPRGKPLHVSSCVWTPGCRPGAEHAAPQAEGPLHHRERDQADDLAVSSQGRGSPRTSFRVRLSWRGGRQLLCPLGHRTPGTALGAVCHGARAPRPRHRGLGHSVSHLPASPG